jgi:hypothetical protein
MRLMRDISNFKGLPVKLQLIIAGNFNRRMCLLNEVADA